MTMDQGVRFDSSKTAGRKFYNMACFSGLAWPAWWGTRRWRHSNLESCKIPSHWWLMTSAV